MKLLLVGSGGRENALAWKLSQSEDVDEIIMARGNAGGDYRKVDIDPMDIEGLVSFAKEEGVDFTLVGPEDPICSGIVDRFQEEGLRIFGPDKRSAQFEKSKQFTKEFLIRNNIPTAKSLHFSSYDEAISHLEKFSYPLVVKADGLCQGKGVSICQDRDEADLALRKIFIERAFGDGGEEVVIEEFLKGEESSLLCLVSKNKIFPLERAKDHKQVDDKDQGPNTGGMGCYSPVEYDEETRKNVEEILKRIEKGFEDEGFSYTGILFIGFMTEKNLPKVLEFNVRFGDPETEALMPRLKSDLFLLLNKAIDGTLRQEDLVWSDQASIAVVLVSGGYPGSYEKGYEIKGLGDLDSDIIAFHNGTKREGNKILTDGGRVLTITALADSLEEAKEKAYKNIERISFQDMHYRRDIDS